MAVLKDADLLDSRDTDLYQEGFRDYLTSKNMSAKHYLCILLCS